MREPAKRHLRPAGIVGAQEQHAGHFVRLT
jgi:hypothetical protein